MAVLRSLIVAVTLFLLAQPIAASAQRVEDLADELDGPVDSSNAATRQIEPDPTDFDPLTTTDTEVGRMRVAIAGERFSAELVDRAAASMLREARAEHTRAERELEAAEDHLAMLQGTLGVTAIEGYLDGSDGGTGSFFAEGIDEHADETRANATASQIVTLRQEAQLAVDEATAFQDRAAQRLRIARSRKDLAEQSLVTIGDRQTTFDDLAEQHAFEGARADRAAAAMSADVELTSVAGAIIVNVEIEEELDRLIADARRDGIDFSGGGYRTIESQIALRIAHCGGGGPAPEPLAEDATPEDQAAHAAALADLEASRNYAIYEAPASSCSPPTATPGNSEHQAGLAVDFTVDGAILDWSSPGFQWLKEHADDYGLLNLPSEAWHWSTTGR